MKFKEYPNTTTLADNDAFIVDGDGGTKHLLAKDLVVPATKKYVDDTIANKVDKVEGMGLSTNDLTDTYKKRLDALPNNLANKASCSSVLMTIVPNSPFTPKTDYHPATKKYVDDSVSALRTELLALINKS